MRDREALAHAKSLRSSQSPIEQRLWYHLRAKRFQGAKFRRQTPCGHYIVDFTCRSAMLAIELDGDTHVGREAYDARRTAFLESLGFRVLRFSNLDVANNLEWVLETIARTLAASPSP